MFVVIALSRTFETDGTAREREGKKSKSNGRKGREGEVRERRRLCQLAGKISFYYCCCCCGSCSDAVLVISHPLNFSLLLSL